jgi:hypothetical protein
MHTIVVNGVDAVDVDEKIAAFDIRANRDINHTVNTWRRHALQAQQ